MRFLFLSIGFVALTAVSACKNFANEPPNWKALEAAAENGDSKSLALLRTSAERGDAKAQFQMGTFFVHQTEVDQSISDEVVMADYAEAAKWWRRAAEQGDQTAPLALGLNEMNPYAHPPRPEAETHAKAAKWFRMAAERGRTDAQYQLGYLYIMETVNSRLGHEKNPHTVPSAEAFKWLRTAAQHGHAESQYWLAALYIEPNLGQAQPNYEEAYFWVTACAKKLEACQPSVLSQNLSLAQIAALKKRAAEWKPLPPNSTGQ